MRILLVFVEAIRQLKNAIFQLTSCMNSLDPSSHLSARVQALSHDLLPSTNQLRDELLGHCQMSYALVSGQLMLLAASNSDRFEDKNFSSFLKKSSSHIGCLQDQLSQYRQYRELLTKSLLEVNRAQIERRSRIFGMQATIDRWQNQLNAIEYVQRQSRIKRNIFTLLRYRRTCDWARKQATTAKAAASLAAENANLQVIRYDELVELLDIAIHKISGMENAFCILIAKIEQECDAANHARQGLARLYLDALLQGINQLEASLS